MIKLLQKHSDDAELVRLVMRVSTNSTYENHAELRNHIKENGYDGVDYKKEFHMFMYIVENNEMMVWKDEEGEYHREDKDKNGRTLPAMISLDGKLKFWYKHGLEHREDKDENGRQLPAIEDTDGGCEYLINGEHHRVDKDDNGLTLPSMDYPKRMEWKKNGQSHRADLDSNGEALPSIIFENEKRYYYFEGKQMTKDELTNLILQTRINVQSPQIVEIELECGLKIIVKSAKTLKYFSA